MTITEDRVRELIREELGKDIGAGIQALNPLWCDWCQGTGKRAVATDLLLRSPEEQARVNREREANAPPCEYCSGSGRRKERP